MGAAAAEADRTLFVGNLETKVTEELLFELFHQVSGGGQPSLPCPLARGPAQGPSRVSRAGLAGVRAPSSWAGARVALRRRLSVARLAEPWVLPAGVRAQGRSGPQGRLPRSRFRALKGRRTRGSPERFLLFKCENDT